METLATNRLILRNWQETDVPALFKYASDPEVSSRAGWPPHKSVEDKTVRVLRLDYALDNS